MTADAHFVHSALRENIIEHTLIGSLLRRLWELGIYDAEILKSEFDAGGYDLVLSRKNIVRHIQLKVSRLGGRTSKYGINLKLADKPSGCVVAIIVDDRLNIDHYLWFGNELGMPLSDLSDHKATKHTKANAAGYKAERLSSRDVKRSAFGKPLSMDGLIDKLLGISILTGTVE